MVRVDVCASPSERAGYDRLARDGTIVAHKAQSARLVASDLVEGSGVFHDFVEAFLIRGVETLQLFV